MKNIIFSILLILFFLRCDFYKSEFPITNQPSSEIPLELLGNWYFLDTVGDFILPISNIEILNYEDKKYIVSWKTYEDKKHESQKLLKVWNSKVGEKEFFNSKLLKNNSKQYFRFYKYQLGKNNTIELTFLTDSLKMKFQNQKAFYQFVENNPKEFDTYFHPFWFSFQRIDSVKWGVVNSIWKNEIDQVLRFEKLPKKIDFSKIIESDLEPFLSIDKIDRDSILDILENSYLNFNQTLSFKLPPKF